MTTAICVPLAAVIATMSSMPSVEVMSGRTVMLGRTMPAPLATSTIGDTNSSSALSVRTWNRAGGIRRLLAAPGK